MACIVSEEPAETAFNLRGGTEGVNFVIAKLPNACSLHRRQQ
jgi:hypothetical protein